MAGVLGAADAGVVGLRRVAIGQLNNKEEASNQSGPPTQGEARLGRCGGVGLYAGFVWGMLELVCAGQYVVLVR